MNENQPTARLEAIRAEHRMLDAQIAALIAVGDGDMLEIARLKRRKLRLKDELEQLRDSAVPDLLA